MHSRISQMLYAFDREILLGKNTHTPYNSFEISKQTTIHSHIHSLYVHHSTTTNTKS